MDMEDEIYSSTAIAIATSPINISIHVWEAIMAEEVSSGLKKFWPQGS